MKDLTDFENSKKSVETILAEFDAKKDLLSHFCERTKNLVEDCLNDEHVRFQSVQARVKAREKLKTKYLDSQKSYKELNDITDQAALRVITYYEDDVDRVAEIIKKQFDIDAENSIDKRETEPDKFGYYALNYVCQYSSDRASQPEYRKFAGIYCELQITSILRHAWSEIEHPWYDLKDAFPDDIKRRFARMAALLEIAESEFLSLKKLQGDYTKSLDLQVEAMVPDVTIDAVSLRSFIIKEPLVHKIDKAIASVLGTALIEGEPAPRTVDNRLAIANLAHLTKLDEIRSRLGSYEAQILMYVASCRSLWPIAAEAKVAQGLCIWHLGMLIVSSRGEVEIAKAYDFFKLPYSPKEIANQAANVKAILGTAPGFYLDADK